MKEKPVSWAKKIKQHRLLLNSIMLLIILCMCSITTISCRPSSNDNERLPRAHAYKDPAERRDRELYGSITDDEYESIKQCNANLTLMELCMRCSKVTKVRLVYPSCCGDKDDVRSWCREYIYYGVIRPYENN